MSRKDQLQQAQANARLYTDTPPALRLNSVGNIRKSMARVIRRYNQNGLPDYRYRALIWGLQCLIGAVRTEKDIEEFAARLDALEERTQ